MYIENRKKKIESDKLIKEILLYLYLLRDGKAYDYQLSVVSPTFERTLQRYSKELSLSGAIPKIRLKHDENGLFYEVNDLINTNKRFYKYEDNDHSNRLARVITIAYLKEVNHPIASNKADLKKFYFERLNPNSSDKTFSRDLKLLDFANKYYNNNKQK